jgi:hydroxypyruvate reductase
VLALAQSLITTALRAADAGDAVRRADLATDLVPQLTGPSTPLALLAIGKASLAMARAAHESLGPRITHSFATTLPEHAADPFWKSLPGPALACDHPLPTPRNVDAARRLETWVNSLPTNAVLAVLLSGGASAHLCSPALGLTLDDIIHATRTLQHAGADIHELNCIRRHCETLKGGGLARLAHPRPIVTLILSDVIGDPLHDIASGPTAPDPTTRADALAIANKYNLATIANFLAHSRENTTVSREPLTHSHLHIIASNRHVAHAVHEHLTQHHFTTYQLLDIQASVPDVAALITAHAHRHSTHTGPLAIITAGEWTVDTRTCPNPGLGGPSQELALTIAHTLKLTRPWTFITLSTDGRDGPTDHAGAIVTHATGAHDLAAALARHDASPTLAALNCLVTTGPTGTNLNHIAVLLT